MLRLIFGGFGSGKSRRVLDMIGECTAKKSAYDKSIYLIVPEQDTVRAELEAASTLAPKTALCFEVQNFSRLANSVFRSLGGLSYKYADSASKALCMWQSMSALGGLLYQPCEEADEHRIHSVLSVISELRASGIDIKKLENAANALGTATPLGREMHDLSLICTVYESTLSELYSDSEKDIDKLCDLLEYNKFFAGYDIFIDGFCSFTAPQMRLITTLIRDCASVTVTLPIDRERGRYLYGLESENTARRLETAAQSVGAGVEYIDIQKNKRALYDDLRYLSENLYLSNSDTYTGRSSHIELYECADAREEAEAVCTLIQKKVQGGARYRDIAVVARNAQDYAGILDNAFERHGIPCFFSCETRPESHPMIKLVYSAFSLFCKNCRREEVISYLKTGLCDVEADDCDIFEKYVNTWKINGSRFLADEDFCNSPGGYTDIKTERFDQILERVNRTKKQFCAPLIPFFESLKKENTVKDICVCLWRYLDALKIRDKMEAEAAEYERTGDEQSARECEGIFNCFADTLDTLVATVGGQKVSAHEFSKLLRMCMRTKKVSVIPTSADAVTVGDAHMLRAAGIRHIFLIGACDGSFPLAIKDNGYFDYIKRKQLSAVGIDIEYDIELDASKEMFYYARAVCAASESVSILYGGADASGTAVKISNSSLSLMRLMNIERVCRYGELPIEERVYDAASAEETALTADFESDRENAGICALSLISAETRKEPYELQKKLSDETRRVLFSKKLAMTQARLESYARCHFAFFCRYLLRLEQNSEYDFGAADIGNFVHSVLDSLTEQLTVDGVFRSDISESELEQRAERIISDYISRVCPENDRRSARLLGLIRRIRRSVSLIASNICREFEQSRFVPIAHEMQIKDNSPFNPSPLEFTLEQGAKLSIYGTLDRADVYRRGDDVYVRVIDYKTGAKDFSMKDIEMGMNLQLMIYLFTVCAQTNEQFKRMLGCPEGGRLLPAGMLYYSASVADVNLTSPKSAEDVRKEAERALARKGLLTNDEAVLRAMEPELDGKYIAVTASEDKLKTGRGISLIGADEFDALQKQVGDVITSIANELCAGKVEAEPMVYGGVKSCAWCEMRAICRRYDNDGTASAENADDAE